MAEKIWSDVAVGSGGGAGRIPRSVRNVWTVVGVFICIYTYIHSSFESFRSKHTQTQRVACSQNLVVQCRS